MSRMGLLDLPDGGQLRFDEAGDGPAVLLLHPGLWDRRTWDDQMTSFPASGYRTIRYDQRGYGESSRLTGEPYSRVADLIAILDHLDVEQAALVGVSMGGTLAIDTTLEHPSRVWALVAAAADFSGFEPLREEEDWWDEAGQGIDAAIEAGDLERAEDLRLKIWAPLGTDDPAGATIRRIAFDNIHEMTMDESSAIEIDPPASVRLGEIDVPSLVLIAEHDPPFMRRAGELLAREILDARKVVVEGADHVVNVRQPEAFEDAVLPFLDAASHDEVAHRVRRCGGRGRRRVRRVRRARVAHEVARGPPGEPRTRGSVPLLPHPGGAGRRVVVERLPCGGNLFTTIAGWSFVVGIGPVLGESHRPCTHWRKTMGARDTGRRCALADRLGRPRSGRR